MDPILKAPLVAAAIGAAGTIVKHLWQFNWTKLARQAVEDVSTLQLNGNRVKYINVRRRWLGLRASVKVDVAGPQRGTYLLFISRNGNINHIHPLKRRRRKKMLPRPGSRTF